MLHVRVGHLWAVPHTVPLWVRPPEASSSGEPDHLKPRSRLRCGELTEGWRPPYRTYTLRPEVSTSLLLTCRWQQQTLMSIVVSATPPRGGFSPKAKLENLIKELLMLAVFSFQLQRRFNSRHIRYHKWIQPATDTVRRVSKHERNHVIISAVTVAGTVSVRTDCSSRRGRTQLTANPCS